MVTAQREAKMPTNFPPLSKGLPWILELEWTGLGDPLVTIPTHTQAFREGLPRLKGCIQGLGQVHTQACLTSDPQHGTHKGVLIWANFLNKHAKVEMRVLNQGR